jgi:hypothetical protein
MRERRGVYRVLLGKYEGKRPLGRPSRRWEDNIKDVGFGSMDCIELAQDSEKCGNELSDSIICGEFLD